MVWNPDGPLSNWLPPTGAINVIAAPLRYGIQRFSPIHACFMIGFSFSRCPHSYHPQYILISNGCDCWTWRTTTKDPLVPKDHWNRDSMQSARGLLIPEHRGSSAFKQEKEKNPVLQIQATFKHKSHKKNHRNGGGYIEAHKDWLEPFAL